MANGLRVGYEQWGDDGPLAVLVHGFPDTPTTWRHLGPILADAGFRAVAPWTRGYAPTDIPADGDYTVDARAADLNRLHAVLGGDARAVLIGHDWGANAAYAAAAAAPSRWRRVVTVAVPPEPVLHGMERRPADLRHTDNVRAALSYYRAHFTDAVRHRYPRSDGPVPTQPTLYLHGTDDRCLRVGYAAHAARVLRQANPTSEARTVAGTGHFPHLEAPDRVGGLVLLWVTGA
jgi:pimeloyl-ACP methyl ester carboxylesterase